MVKMSSILRLLNESDDTEESSISLSKLRIRVSSRKEEMQHLCGILFIYSKMAKLSSRIYDTLLKELTLQMSYKFNIT